MRAAVFRDFHQPLCIETLPDPTPGADEVIVRVSHCGICGSDLHMSEDAALGAKCGDVFGHEFAGEVVARGSAARRLRVGDHVSVLPLRACGTCPSCLAGEPAWCARMRLEGGGYGEYACTTERQCVRLPHDLGLAEGAIVEPLAVALHGVRLSGLKPGDRAVILGAGPIGLAAAWWARRMGAAEVVVIDLNRLQEARAMEMGATRFLIGNATGEGLPETLGWGADIVFECVGRPGMIAQGVDLLRNRGTLLVLGLCTQVDTFVPFTALSKEIRIQTSVFYSQAEFEAATDAIALGAAIPRALVTGMVALDALPEAFEALKRRTGECKVLIDHRRLAA